MLKKQLILFSLLLLAFSCKKHDSVVGVNVLPETDQLGAEYAEINASLSYTLFDDTANTTNITNSNLLGSFDDPVFGRTDASIYSNFELQGILTNSLALGTNAVLDSAVLSLVYNPNIGWLGDTSENLSIDVYPLQQRIYRDSTYYSRRSIPYKNYSMLENGQSKTFRPALYTRVLINKDDPSTANPQLRLRLRKEFGEMLFNINYLSSLYAFQNAFYGFYITTNHSILPQPTYGSIVYIDMNRSAIQLYYHNDQGPQAPLPIVCGANSLRFGHFDHDYKFLGDPGLVQQIYPPFDSLGRGKQDIFLQGATSLKAKIGFPDLLKWVDSNIVINKAQLELKIDQSQSNYSDLNLYPPPSRLYLENEDPSTKKPTTLIESIYTFGGGYDATNKEYTFLIPHTVARIISKKLTSTNFYLSVYTSPLFPQRVVLGGYGNATYPIKLKLWYTRLSFSRRMVNPGASSNKPVIAPLPQQGR